MLAGQYKSKHVVTQFNLSSFLLESEAITPYNYILQKNLINLAYVGGDLGAGYRVVKKPKFEFDALISVKFVYFRVGLATDLLGDYSMQVMRDHLWTDPVIATNLVYRPHPRISLAGHGDFGGTLLNRDYTYQLYLNLNFLLTKHIIFSLGYREYFVKVPEENAIYMGSMRGLVFKIGAQF